jgi:hypothetical protein
VSSYQAKDGLTAIGKGIENGLKAIAEGLSQRGGTYNVIVNVPVGADQDEISRKVVSALEHAEAQRYAQRRSSRA